MRLLFQLVEREFEKAKVLSIVKSKHQKFLENTAVYQSLFFCSKPWYTAVFTKIYLPDGLPALAGRLAAAGLLAAEGRAEAALFGFCAFTLL